MLFRNVSGPVPCFKVSKRFLPVLIEEKAVAEWGGQVTPLGLQVRDSAVGASCLFEEDFSSWYAEKLLFLEYIHCFK